MDDTQGHPGDERLFECTCTVPQARVHLHFDCGHPHQVEPRPRVTEASLGSCSSGGMISPDPVRMESGLVEVQITSGPHMGSGVQNTGVHEAILTSQPQTTSMCLRDTVAEEIIELTQPTSFPTDSTRTLCRDKQ